MSQLRWLLVVCGLFLAACQSDGVRPEGAGSEDATGQLGAVRPGPSPADVYVQLGTAYLADGKLTEALKNARKAVMADPRLPAAFTLLGIVHQRLGQTGPAGEAFRKAVQLGPHDPYALNAMGTYLCGEGQYDEADAYFRRALENPLYQTPWVALYNAGSCAEKAGRMTQAETDYRAALRKNPRFAPALLRMAHISFDQDKFLSARAYLERYAAVAPHTADSLWLGVRTEKQLGDMDQMANYAIKLRARFPDSEQARFLGSARQ
ncbi:MAG: type IV pilus biogenesis/stability protein PilW [Gammaproteobacteria bacterium]|nr:MAG: type IV pilus biogenesis/stability protein PilW [Gammaproteobacteria bacterium]